MSKYGHRTHNWFEAIVNKLGGEESAEAFLREEPTVSKPTRWREKDSVISFSVTSDGTTGKEWITRLKECFRIGKSYTISVLRSPDFKPTNGVTTQIAVLKGMLFIDKDRITQNIRAKADRRKLIKPNAEAACLIREKFTDKEIEAMGLWWIVTMHEPINDFGGDPRLLSAGRYLYEQRLEVCDGSTGRNWSRESGFAFAVSQV